MFSPPQKSLILDKETIRFIFNILMAAGISGQTAPTGAVGRGLGSDKLSDGEPPPSHSTFCFPESAFYYFLLKKKFPCLWEHHKFHLLFSIKSS